MILTPQDLELYKRGIVSQRLKDLWGSDLTIEEIQNDYHISIADGTGTEDQKQD